MVRVAIVTGGASGIGLAVCTALSKRQDEEWHIHILDRNAEQGLNVASSIKGAHFHSVDITDYTGVSTAFEKIFKSEGRLDFVHSNAGIVEAVNFYARHDDIDGPPPKLDHRVTEINFKGMLDVSYLALHYFRRNKETTDPILVLTSSIAGLYPVEQLPMYSGIKSGIIGFVRGLSHGLVKEGIRVNTICPGAVLTNIMGPHGFDSVPKQNFTPVEEIADAVMMLIDGRGVKDSGGTEVKDGELNGLTVEVFKGRFYFRDQPEYCDKVMKALIEGNYDSLLEQRD